MIKNFEAIYLFNIFTQYIYATQYLMNYIVDELYYDGLISYKLYD